MYDTRVHKESNQKGCVCFYAIRHDRIEKDGSYDQLSDNRRGRWPAHRTVPAPPGLLLSEHHPVKKMPESILRNGVWEYMRSPLATGDLLTVYIQENESSPNIPPVELPLSIIYEDEDILVVNKPAGMPIHPSLNNYENSLANGLMWYYTQQGKPFIFRCTNRLDRDTSGLTVIAKHLISSSILSSMGLVMRLSVNILRSSAAV